MSSLWHYARIYVPRSCQDEFLFGFARAASSANWFFVRYADEFDEPCRILKPDLAFHLRVRVRQSDMSLAEFTGRIDSCCRKEWRSHYCIDEYHPEESRYGGPSEMETAHRLFIADQRLYTWSTVNSSAFTNAFNASYFHRLLIEIGAATVTLQKAYSSHQDFLREKYFITDNECNQVKDFSDTKISSFDSTVNHFRKAIVEAIPENLMQRLRCDGKQFANPELHNVYPLASLHHMHCNRVGFSIAEEFVVTEFLKNLSQLRC